MWTPVRRAAGASVVLALCAAPLVAQRPEAPPRPADIKVKNPAAPPATAENPRVLPAKEPQPNDRPVPRTVNKPVIGTQTPVQVDQMVASMLALCNEEEAEIGKFAAKHAQHTDVQKFADMMAKDHAQMAKQLQKWAPDATLLPSDQRTADEPKAGTTTAPAAFNPLHVHQQIASRSIASTEKSLGAKKGLDFDMAYVGSQCVLHQQMIDKASVLRQYTSGELRSTIDKGIEAAENHLDRAHELIEKLAGAEKAK